MPGIVTLKVAKLKELCARQGRGAEDSRTRGTVSGCGNTGRFWGHRLAMVAWEWLSPVSLVPGQGKMAALRLGAFISLA